jgi:Zn-dependent protease
MAMVAGAGPIANLVVAVVFAVVFRALDMSGLLEDADSFVTQLLFSIVLFNVVLALFNLLPIPPLDGYNIVLPFLPPQTAFMVQRYAQYGMLALLLLVVLSYGPGGGPIGLLFDAAGWIARLLIGA